MARPTLLTLVLAASILGGAAPAIAQTAPDGPLQSDGAPPDGGRHWGGHGRDHGDGPGHEGPRLFISPSGEPFRGPDGLKRWFDGADTDHDGVITPEEFRADAMRFFKVLDTNGDDFIDGPENQVYETQIVPEITQGGFGGDGGERPQGGGPPSGGGGRGGGHGGGRGGGMGGGGHGGMGGGGGGGQESPSSSGGGRRSAETLVGASRFSLLDEPQPVLAADLNVDFRVSVAEWRKATDRRFAQLDTKHEGKLTLENLPPLPGRHRPPKT